MNQYYSCHISRISNQKYLKKLIKQDNTLLEQSVEDGTVIYVTPVGKQVDVLFSHAVVCAHL